jgi:hypothetical protein
MVARIGDGWSPQRLSTLKTLLAASRMSVPEPVLTGQGRPHQCRVEIRLEQRLPSGERAVEDPWPHLGKHRVRGQGQRSSDHFVDHGGMYSTYIRRRHTLLTQFDDR